jgi:hypothetical protein
MDLAFERKVSADNIIRKMLQSDKQCPRRSYEKQT